jgi:hypothetical protein
MICKICDIPLIDNSYILDIHGSKVKKEEFVCPNEDNHDIIIEEKIIENPTICPVCKSYATDEESRIYKNPKGEVVIAIDLICDCCNLGWTLISNSVEVLLDAERLDGYSEWD